MSFTFKLNIYNNVKRFIEKTFEDTDENYDEIELEARGLIPYYEAKENKRRVEKMINEKIMYFKDNKGRILTSDDVNNLPLTDIDDLMIHTYEEEEWN